jgi:hypothetical protein
VESRWEPPTYKLGGKLVRIRRRDALALIRADR